MTAQNKNINDVTRLLHWINPNSLLNTEKGLMDRTWCVPAHRDIIIIIIIIIIINKLNYYLKITGILNNVFRPQKTP